MESHAGPQRGGNTREPRAERGGHAPGRRTTRELRRDGGALGSPATRGATPRDGTRTAQRQDRPAGPYARPCMLTRSGGPGLRSPRASVHPADLHAQTAGTPCTDDPEARGASPRRDGPTRTPAERNLLYGCFCGLGFGATRYAGTRTARGFGDRSAWRPHGSRVSCCPVR